MSKYDRLDAVIIAAIREGRRPLYARTVSAEASQLAAESGREEFRVIDGRLQALRKAGHIEHDTKHGWRIRQPDGGNAINSDARNELANSEAPVHGVGHMHGRGAA